MRSPARIGYGAVGLAAVLGVVACANLTEDAAPPSPCAAGEQFTAGRCAPGDALLRARVLSVVTGDLHWADEPGRPWMLGHAVELTVDVKLNGQPLVSSLSVRAISPSRKANCTVASLPIRHGSAKKSAAAVASQQTYAIHEKVVVPEA